MTAISQGEHGALDEALHGACGASEEAVHGACGGLGEAARGPMAGRLASVLNWLGAQTLEALSPTRCAGCEAPGQLVCSGCLERLELIDPAWACARCGAPFGRMLCTECYGTRCAGCEAPGQLVCSGCLERLELIDPAWACARCGAPFGRMLCTECYGRTMATDRCLAVAVFQDPLARMIRMYKDAGERRLAEPFAEMLYDAALHAQAEDAERFSGLLARADALVFVPATARAFRRRGFDHMEAIARVLAELSGVPVLDALVKHGAGDQRAWGRLERLMRSHGAYEVVPDAFGALAGARVLLLDDVITTGATVTAAASVLRDAGADGVDALALARVMGPGAG